MQIHLRIQGADRRPLVIAVEAPNEMEAVRLAVSQGAQVLSVETPRAPAGATTGRRGGFALLLFSQELLALLEAGLNLSEALATLHAKENRPVRKELLGEILGALREGRNFSDTLAKYPEHFPDVYIATIRSSERTGGMSEALSRYIAYQVRFDALRSKLVSALIYPSLLLVVGSGVLLFLLGYVVPKFSVVYETTGHDLPVLSAAMLSVGRLINAHSLEFGVGMLTIGALIVFAARQAPLRKRLLDAVLRLPFLEARSNDFRLARFYRAVSLLLAAGLPLHRAIGMVGGLLSGEQQERLAAARLLVEQGQPLSKALVAQNLAGAVADSLIRVGESSGRLSDMLERTAAFHDEDFTRWIDWASRLIEPLLMALIGLVIGAVVVLMYIPIFDLAGSLQ